jgi:hypothetical protein
LAGGIKRPAPEVDAPYGTPLKVYMPFRLNPRIFPAPVSTTVESEAMTLMGPQGTAAGCKLGSEVVADSADRLFGAIAEPVNPAQDAAMPASRVRLPLEKGAEEYLDISGCGCFSTSRGGSSFSLTGSSFL